MSMQANNAQRATAPRLHITSRDDDVHQGKGHPLPLRQSSHIHSPQSHVRGTCRHTEVHCPHPRSHPAKLQSFSPSSTLSRLYRALFSIVHLVFISPSHTPVTAASKLVSNLSSQQYSYKKGELVFITESIILKIIKASAVLSVFQSGWLSAGDIRRVHLSGVDAHCLILVRAH